MEKSFFTPERLGMPFPRTLAASVISHAVRTSGPRDTIYVAGQVATDEHGEVVGVGDLATQTHQVFRNLERVLRSAGASMRDVVSLTAYMTDIRQIDLFRGLRMQYLDGDRPPAITTVGVTGLAHPDLLIEIEVIAETEVRSNG